MTCGSYICPSTNDKTVGLIKNYHVIQQHTRAIPVKEEFMFAHKRSNTKTSNFNKKVLPDFSHCGEPNHCFYKCTQLSENDSSKLSATKVNGGSVHA